MLRWCIARLLRFIALLMWKLSVSISLFAKLVLLSAFELDTFHSTDIVLRKIQSSSFVVWCLKGRLEKSKWHLMRSGQNQQSGSFIMGMFGWSKIFFEFPLPSTRKFHLNVTSRRSTRKRLAYLLMHRQMMIVLSSLSQTFIRNLFLSLSLSFC